MDLESTEDNRARALATIAVQLSESLGVQNKRKLRRLADICLTYYELGVDAGMKAPKAEEKKKIIIAQS